MMRKLFVFGIALLTSATACGDDDDTKDAATEHDHDHGSEHDHDKAGTGGSKAGTGGKGGSGGSATAGKGGTGGSGGAAGSGSNTSQAVIIRFKAMVGDQPFECGKTYTGQGSTSDTAEGADFRFYVQDVTLIDDKGKAVPVTLDARNPWQTKDVALLDFENAAGRCSNGNADMNDEITGTVPAGTYNAIEFTNGVPEALNHGDPTKLPAPLQSGGMTWGWLYGFKFIKLELESTTAASSDAGAAGGLFHLGSTGCSNSEAEDGGVDFDQPPAVACTNPNRNKVRLTNYKLGTSVIIADIAAVFKQADLKQASDCHSSGDSCGPMFQNVGLTYDTSAQLSTQTFYKLE